MTIIYTDNRLRSSRHAVFLQCGSGAVWGGWWQDGSRPFDLLINHYDSTYAGKIPCEVEFRQTGQLPGTKFTAFYSLLTEYPHILEPYEYILLLDDDVQFPEGGIQRLFEIVSQHGWEMAQASLSPDSYCSYPVFLNSGHGGWRRVNGVEIMMPVYARHILPWVKEVFAESVSGWGTDAALAMIGMREGWRAAVVDEVIARHLKPILGETGAYYQMLRRNGIDQEKEFEHLQRKYGFTQPLFYELDG
jgi:hypothetical protein